MTWLIIDAAIVAIIIFSAAISAKRGFVRSLIEVVGSIAVIYLCLTFSGTAANVVYEKTIEPSVINSVEKKIENTAQKTTETVWNALPGFVTDNSSLLGINVSTLSDSIPSGEASAEKLANSAVRTVVRPVVTRLLSMLISVISIIVLMFLVKMLAKALNKLFSISVLGSINRFLGGLLGIVKGLLFCVVFCIAVSLIMSVSKNDFGIFTKDTIDKTYIFRFIYGLLPFSK